MINNHKIQKKKKLPTKSNAKLNPITIFLQQREITKTQLTTFSQIPNAAESLQITMNPYLMG